MMKKLLKVAAVLVLVLVVLIGVGVGVFFYNIDSLAKRGIQDGGTYALGVPTTVNSVSLHVFSGRMSLSNLNVANPPNGSNYGKIIESLSKLKGSSSSSGSDKKFIVHELTIENISIHADLLGAPGAIGQIVNPVGKVNVPIERISLKDIGKTGAGVGGAGVTMEELSKIVVQAVLAAAADKGYGTLPGEILTDLKNAVSSFDGLINLPVAVVGRAGEAVSMIGGAIENVGKAAGDAINNVGKGIVEGIDGLLGGGKDKKDDRNPPKKH
jgi:hypothetical protein